jgi:hypothetical protein
MYKCKRVKALLIAMLFMTIVLMSNIFVPTYAMSAINTETKIETLKTFNIEGNVIEAKRFDIIKGGQHFVQLEVKTTVAGKVITIKSDQYPINKLWPNRNYRYATQTSTLSTCATQALPTYRWDGVLFVKSPGSYTTRVKYDHPDNYNTYYSGQINRDYALKGISRDHIHVSEWRLEDAKFKTTFASIAGLLGPIIAGLLLIPELVSKVIAGIIALVGAICSLLGYALRWFVEWIIQTELNDGWVWTWGYGKIAIWGWTIAAWWSMSFGAWRDWGFFLTI